MPPPTNITLRDVTDDDLPILLEQQLDPEATEMAAFPARDRDAFMAHWEGKVLGNPTGSVRTVLADGSVAGYIAAFDLDGRRLIAYWIGKPFWGRGVATGALRSFLEIERTRPLHALVVEHNVGSIRVLEKCGFVRSDEDPGEPTFDDGVEEFLFVLPA